MDKNRSKKGGGRKRRGKKKKKKKKRRFGFLMVSTVWNFTVQYKKNTY